ncbi:von Willebrand factor A domain-containing protein 5B2 isoform X2 [Ambystoma mexicanum]|uniref:von Willebrand factor A domain-containing protein 5B2 isoform X2 n=1 Tax=Ambystoma mexicanum TaxID=8296 RepID=UPI0037E8721C
MPGFYNHSTWSPLPLKTSSIKACANGFTMGLTAHLTYTNAEIEPVEGVFIFPLEETEVVGSFEAVTSGRTVTAHIQSRGKTEDCCIDCSTGTSLALRCTNGHLILDEELERSTFVISVGLVAPSETVSIRLTSSQELGTLRSGAVHMTLSPVFTPLVAGLDPPSEPAGGPCDDSPTSCFGGVGGAGGLKADASLRSLAPSSITEAFTGQACTPCCYEFSFEMLVKGPCLLAGLESPSHSLRADAHPNASSASTICITLAERHKCDRNLEIILHPSEPHRPHLLFEEGSMSFPEYEAHIKNRRDYIRVARKESEMDMKVAFVQKRFHKDIYHNPTLMLNFCPNLCHVPMDLRTVTREVIFIIDRSGSMSGSNIEKIKEAMQVAVKSLPPGTLLNIVGFGSNIRTLFTMSKHCNTETLGMAFEYIQKMRADMGGTNILAALTWVFAQPVHRGYPRQLFILTDATVNNSGKVIELVRRYASMVRCFSFGMGPNACRRLLRGVAKVSGGRAEFFTEGERLQPKLIKSLKKALEPAVSDITIDWYVPDTMEALLSPNEIAPLYPGDRLISYCTLYHIASFRGKKAAVRERGCKTASRGSISSVFQSQEDTFTSGAPDFSSVDPTGDSQDIEKAVQDISREISLEFSAAGSEDLERGGSALPSGDIRRRIYQASYIQEQYMLTHCSVSTDRSHGLTHDSVSSERSHSQIHGSTSSESASSREVASENSPLPQVPEIMSQQGQKSVSAWESLSKSSPLSRNEASSNKSSAVLSSEELVRKRKALVQATMSGRSFSTPQGELDMHRLSRALEKVSQIQKQKRNLSMEARLEEIGPDVQRVQRSSLTRRSLADSGNLLSPCQMDWDMFVDPQYLFSPSLAAEDVAEPEEGLNAMLQCRIVIHGLSAGKPVSWEVVSSLESLLGATDEQKQAEDGKAMGNFLHRLTARSVIRDIEDIAEKESEIEHTPEWWNALPLDVHLCTTLTQGSSRKFRLKAIQSSKACSVLSMYTCMVPIDSRTKELLPGAIDVRNAGHQFGHHRGSHSGSRRHRSYSAGLGRRQDCEGPDEALISTEKDTSPASPVSPASTCGWEKQSYLEGHTHSPSAHSISSQKSIENFFGSRFSLGKRRGGSPAGKLTPLKPPCLSGESEITTGSESQDYLPLVRLQLAHGAFHLNDTFSHVVQIPLDRLCRASPYASHRASLSPVSSVSPRALTARASQDGTASSSSASSSRRAISPLPEHKDVTSRSGEDVGRVDRHRPRLSHDWASEQHPILSRDIPPGTFYQSFNSCPEVLSSMWQQADSGRGSETDACEHSPATSEASVSFPEPEGFAGEAELESSSWATAVALAWLEHQCAEFFTEWELVAAKADTWLRDQQLPEGIDLSCLKGAARHLFLLLRHWDENIKLNILCYSPSNM